MSTGNNYKSPSNGQSANNNGSNSHQHNQSELHCTNIFNLDGRVAVVTGGTSGLGSMIAHSLVSNGCKVYLVSRHLDHLQRVCQEFSSHHGDHAGRLIPIQVDLSTREGAEKLRRELEKHEKWIDLMINAAKMSGQRIHLNASNDLNSISDELMRQDQKEADAVLRTNVVGLYFAIANLLPLIGRSPHHPQIINVAGFGGLSREPTNGLIEPASQAGVIHMTKNLATLLARSNVRCNVIAPGIFPGRGEHDRHGRAGQEGSSTKELMSKIPCGRVGNEKDIGATILFLCSKHQTYVSGAVIPLDGGMLSVVPSCY